MIEQLRVAVVFLLVLVGLFFTFVSTAGLLRLPDVYSRSHTASQADTLGAGFTLAAVAVALGFGPTTSRTVLLLIFIFVTNPTAAHAISRAADEEGVRPWTVDDDRTDQDLHDASGIEPDGGRTRSAAVSTADSVRGPDAGESTADSVRGPDAGESTADSVRGPDASESDDGGTTP